MPARDVQIAGLAPGYRKTRITIGDTQVPTEALSGITIQADVDDIPRLTLDVITLDTTTVSGEMEILIPDQTRDLLVQLGWTPPAGT